MAKTYFLTADSDTFVFGDRQGSVFAQGGNDTVVGNDGDNTIGLGIGDDNAQGGGGADLIWGNAGNDEIDGGVPALHCPERLKDKQLLHHAARALLRSVLRLTPGSISAAGSGVMPAAISISASLISLAMPLPTPRPAAATRRPPAR